MIDRIKEFFCKQGYFYEEGDILFKKTSPVAVVIVEKRTTLKGKAAYKVMEGLNRSKVVFQLELARSQFTHGCLVNVAGFNHKFRVLYPMIASITSQAGYRVEMLTKRGKSFATKRESFYTASDFKNVAKYNIFDNNSGKWSNKK